ncbi:Tryptophan RNA-binding attenuator protein-like [Tripterygium wilfordii]|uniref:Tryptophan RNA-binding attenuator protein-like n=1 Tax=Tripterygium wilfordii TaxID=458696 RepID=A0A7J7C6U2_TRIWF|nr:Tryptophan RNA-binding attenuator protein-like [Tripterygium wilfordii]
MAAPFFSTPFQPYVYQSPHEAVIPFQILGGEAQVVQIMLKPEEKVVAKPGSMCFMSGTIEMENVYAPENVGGMWQWLFGKTMTSIVLQNPGPSDGFVGIAAPSVARILPIDLAVFGGELLCQPDAFLCSINDVKVSNTVDQRARNIVTGVEGFLRQKLSGQGLAFIVAGGSVVQKNLEVGEVFAVDVSCLVALTASVNVQIKYNGPLRRAVFGGDNLVIAVLTGPGIVFIQSLPFNRLSQRVARVRNVVGLLVFQGSHNTQHEGKPQVFRSDSHLLFPGLCRDCIFINLNRFIEKPTRVDAKVVECGGMLRFEVHIENFRFYLHRHGNFIKFYASNPTNNWDIIIFAFLSQEIKVYAPVTRRCVRTFDDESLSNRVGNHTDFLVHPDIYEEHENRSL